MLHHTYTHFVEQLLGAHTSETVLYEAKAVVEAFNRIVHVYKHTQSTQSIKPMKLAKCKVTPFQAIKLTCASELEVKL